MPTGVGQAADGCDERASQEAGLGARRHGLGGIARRRGPAGRSASEARQGPVPARSGVAKMHEIGGLSGRGSCLCAGRLPRHRGRTVRPAPGMPRALYDAAPDASPRSAVQPPRGSRSRSRGHSQGAGVPGDRRGPAFPQEGGPAAAPEAGPRPAALARPAGFEPATSRLEGGCSIRLSYGRPGLLCAPGGRGARPERRPGHGTATPGRAGGQR